MLPTAYCLELSAQHLVPAPRPWKLAVVRDFAQAPISNYVASIHHAIGQNNCPYGEKDRK